jgi:hypothetical protein
MSKVKATVVAVSRKLLRVIFAIASKNALYGENYSYKNHFKLAT